ncbi:D-glycero-beta-D-manno-heptose 1-phosphate adenylyltransferase [Parapusillimonas granuli]|uniref:D-glycero-beta-D-manno-heptose 1-phosphate adenylyltransferase n=1 Tax=Parapusillimonas granuli TaxID=380911 RepID=A0A853FVQ6_9BURK|nr:D-glycero-beta-D-manno-heptose 1-phosphate adenylyltransferase [Parapusillimonas granuli]MBB5214704.1 rfaE bifunctional protein nucleotidyltransferase chain/domain [Parapusillimonas granuli]MEB2398048.1 D-glycero-beta-D-manno-heptose 1-phosphate adenylyltransferase [Alcaligenaceae bacterium]NYT48888.1 D-glycero-beta-D-manno-heptose 1-phosphate adenylyltransferase [Parapusillimonas granuli]
MTVRFEAKILSRDACVAAVKNGALPRPIIFTNGVFDILHRGHASYLDEAAQLGASLIVAVNTDASARRLGKGADRPLNTEEDRAALLAALASVTVVTSFDEDTPQALIEALRPDVIVKGGDYDMESLPETASVKAWGGRAVAIPFRHQRSTTALVRKIRGGDQPPGG